MSYQIIQPIEELEALKFLSEIHNQKDYDRQVDGPYLVARIIDQERFCTSSPQTVAECDYEQQLTDDVSQLDKYLGWSPLHPQLFCDWSCNTPARDEAQREGADRWHQDDEETSQKEHWPEFLRFYAVSSNDGTLYIKESITRARPRPKWFRTSRNERRGTSLRDQLTEAARSEGVLMKCENYGLYLFPKGVWHCAPISPDGAPRTFCRINLYTYEG
jgi:hypothetical protein